MLEETQADKLQLKLKSLQQQVRHFKQEKADLEILLENITEHAGAVENELYDAHNTLELQVKARTQELAQKNIQLEEEIKERRRAEDLLKKAHDELEEHVEERTAELRAINKELETFAYSVSHDLRGPLRSIDGFSKILSEDYSGALDDKAQGYLSRVRKASQRMGDIIDDLLSLSLITRTDIKRDNVNLSEIARSISENLLTTEQSRKVTFGIEDNITVDADPKLMKIVMENLLGNAWKYTGRNQEALIELGKTRIDEKSTVYVKDNGIGFNMKYMEKLFGVFQRLHHVDEFEGSGIGLATVKRIVLRHGGSIWAESRENEGAVFYFTLKA